MSSRSWVTLGLPLGCGKMDEDGVVSKGLCISLSFLNKTRSREAAAQDSVSSPSWRATWALTCIDTGCPALAAALCPQSLSFLMSWPPSHQETDALKGPAPSWPSHRGHNRRNCLTEHVTCVRSAATSESDKGRVPCLLDSVVSAFWTLTFLLGNGSL